MPHDISNSDIDGWLNTLNLTSRSRWELLIFLYRHQVALLCIGLIARFLGYTHEAVLAALTGLEDLGLVQCYRVSHSTRLHQVMVPCAPPRRDAWTALLALASHRVGRVRLAGRLRGRDATP